MAQLIDSTVKGNLDVEGETTITGDILVEDSELATLITQIDAI
jgi:hypothetical protein